LQEMSEHRYNFDAAECDRKWRALLKTYHRNAEEEDRWCSGAGRKKWVYFDIINEILGTSASSVTALPKKSSSSSASSTDVEESGDGHVSKKTQHNKRFGSIPTGTP